MSKIETFDLKQLIGNFFALKQHNHGNILDGGTINTDILSNETLNKILITDSNNKIKTLNKLPLDKVTHQDISGKADVNHTQSTSTITETSKLNNLGTQKNATQHDINNAIDTKMSNVLTFDVVEDEFDDNSAYPIQNGIVSQAIKTKANSSAVTAMEERLNDSIENLLSQLENAGENIETIEVDLSNVIRTSDIKSDYNTADMPVQASVIKQDLDSKIPLSDGAAKVRDYNYSNYDNINPQKDSAGNWATQQAINTAINTILGTHTHTTNEITDLGLANGTTNGLSSNNYTTTEKNNLTKLNRLYEGVYVQGTSNTINKPFLRLFRISIVSSANYRSNQLTFEIVGEGNDRTYAKIKVDLRQNLTSNTPVGYAKVTPLNVYGLNLSELYFATHQEHGNMYVDIFRKVGKSTYFTVKVYDDHHIHGTYTQYSPIVDDTEAYTDLTEAQTILDTTYTTIEQGDQYTIIDNKLPNTNIIANKFIKTNGTSNQFLKADGSVDENSYSLTSHTHSNYINPDIIDNLDSTDNTKVLSAKQGNALKNMITSIDLIEIIPQNGALPTTNIDSNKLYFVPNSNQKNENKYDIYAHTGTDWEKIDSLDININDYLKKEELIAGTGLYKQSNNNNTVLNISEQGVGTNELANNAVTSNKIVNEAITYSKLNKDARCSFDYHIIDPEWESRDLDTYKNKSGWYVSYFFKEDYNMQNTPWDDDDISQEPPFLLKVSKTNTPPHLFGHQDEENYIEEIVTQEIYTIDDEYWIRSYTHLTGDDGWWNEWHKIPLIDKNDEIVLNDDSRLSVATSGKNGLLSSSDKVKLDNINISEYLKKADLGDGTGLSKSGTTLNHSNSVTAQSTAALKSLTFDSEGHITNTTDPFLSDIKIDELIPATNTTFDYNITPIQTKTQSITHISSGTSNRENCPNGENGKKYGGLLITQQLYKNNNRFYSQTFYRIGTSEEIWYRHYDSAQNSGAGIWYPWIRIDGQNKVDTISGKGLSTNDYTTEEKNKLSGIATEANKTIVDSSLNSTSTNPVQNKVIKEALENVTGDLLEYIVNNYDQYDWE